MTAGERLTRLDVAAAPLSGTTLIEANAGTGKTWTITALYIRLLLEAARGVEQILVVTFTETATAELRDRIRARIAETHAVLEAGSADLDPFIASVLTRVTDRADALRRLESALCNFDQAAIYTIHGFCQRVLGDRAFESAMPFRTELVPDQSELLREIVEDFWRTELYGASPLFAAYLVQQDVNPATLQKDLEGRIGKRHVVLRGPDEPKDCPALEQAYAAAWCAARTIWVGGYEDIGKGLVNSTSLNRASYKREAIPEWLREMTAWLTPEAPALDPCARFDKFTTASLVKATNRNGSTPKHAFHDACDALKEARAALLDGYGARLARLKMHLVAFCDHELAVRKKARQLQSYDDLLLNLHDALRDRRASGLTAELRKRYTAALIDEFQDTDPVQYEIFDRIYGESGLPVFFVGDPKQSIYSFRGADVFAYLNARRDATAAHTLDVNWRSAPQLLEAVNGLFGRVPAPFVFEDIPFHSSRPAPTHHGRFEVDGGEGAALEIWFAASEDGKPLNKGAARERAAEATAAEIARLMSLGNDGQAMIVEPRAHARRIAGGDIAVLVRTHREGKLVRDALARRGVASVQRGSENVFASAEAAELERVLLAVAEPGRESLVSGALATEIMGCTGEALLALQSDEARWEAIVESFRQAQRDWHDHGFIRMLRAFFQRHDAVRRLLEYSDGERRVTNLLHLAERLHCEAEAHGMSGLIAWLGTKRLAPGNANEEELLRLESDENLVKILTVHVAKGLEFPLVFCPFLWDGSVRSARKEVVSFHDPAQRFASVVDFGSPTRDLAREQAKREELAENLRLLYVALTRAKYRCWMVWGHIADAETSAPAWLLQSGRGAGWGEGKPDAQRMRADLDVLVASANGAIRVTDLPQHPADTTFMPAAPTHAHLAARTFQRALRDTRRVTSFTGLAHGRAIEAPDYDAGDRPAEPDIPIAGRDIFAFRRGAHAGKCLHAIFEHLDFASSARAELEHTVTHELTAHGFDTQWVRAVSDMVQSVIATPLDASGALRLDAIARSKRLDELEFYYPIRDLSDAALREILLSSGFPDEIRERIGELNFSPAQGYMRGFIDLVFEHGGRYYIVDYKSNWLGASHGAYEQPHLAKAMAREAYYLQYLVYCVALHRYLSARVSGYTYESHFGGIRYLFVRGMRPDLGPSCGVYSDRPPQSLVAALDEYLRTGERKRALLEKPVQGVLDL